MKDSVSRMAMVVSVMERFNDPQLKITLKKR